MYTHTDYLKCPPSEICSISDKGKSNAPVSLNNVPAQIPQFTWWHQPASYRQAQQSYLPYYYLQHIYMYIHKPINPTNISIYIYIHIHVCAYMCIYTYIQIPSHSIYLMTPPGIGSACAPVVSLYICMYIYIYAHSIPQHLLDDATRHRVGMCRSCVGHIRIWGFGRREYTLRLRALYVCVYVSVCVYVCETTSDRERNRESVFVCERAQVCRRAQQL